MHATFLLLNKMLNGATPGSVRDYVFAFKLISVPLLPCLIYTNSLLRNISSKPNLNTGCLTREVIRATGFTQGYALGVTGFLCLTAAYDRRSYSSTPLSSKPSIFGSPSS